VARRHQFGDLRLVGIPHHPFHAGHGGQFIGRALRVASGHQDARRGVLAMHAAHGLPHVFIGGLGDGAGVQHHQVRVAALRRRFQPLGRKQRLERGAIGLGGPAAEILDEELTHSVDLGTLEVVQGELPRRALNLVQEWATIHREELLQDWRFCRENRAPAKIEPLA
jgi:hypothetical protein